MLKVYVKCMSRRKKKLTFDEVFISRFGYESQENVLVVVVTVMDQTYEYHLESW
jgi:hypothetical protein